MNLSEPHYWKVYYGLHITIHKPCIVNIRKLTSGMVVHFMKNYKCSWLVFCIWMVWLFIIQTVFGYLGNYYIAHFMSTCVCARSPGMIIEESLHRRREKMCHSILKNSTTAMFARSRYFNVHYVASCQLINLVVSVQPRVHNS